MAVELGWFTGSRSDHRIYPAHRPLSFLDAEWVKPKWAAHVAAAERERPCIAAVPDVMDAAEMERVLEQAQEISPHCCGVLIIPKAEGVIEQLPRSIGGKRVILGYSVPTRYGATSVPPSKFQGWPVHLLGGTPRAQLKLAQCLDVVSADGNMCQKVSRWGTAFTVTGGNKPVRALVGEVTQGVPSAALRLSFTNLKVMWTHAGFSLLSRQQDHLCDAWTNVAPATELCG